MEKGAELQVWKPWLKHRPHVFKPPESTKSVNLVGSEKWEGYFLPNKSWLSRETLYPWRSEFCDVLLSAEVDPWHTSHYCYVVFKAVFTKSEAQTAKHPQEKG